MKRIDFTEISPQMHHQMKAQLGNQYRGKSLRASRFTDIAGRDDGNGHFGSIDVNFKRQIDLLKQGKHHTLAAASNVETPLRGQINLQHNDSIYQSSVNQSINSGLGITPQRIQFEGTYTGGKRRNGAPFGT